VRVKLKVAILESGHTQRRLSLASGIPETRLSAIVCGRVVPTQEERSVILQMLARPPDEDLFVVSAVPEEAA